MKLSFITRENAANDCIKAIKAFFKQIRRVGNKKAFIAPWYENNNELEYINNIL